jgi:hypothetical protein
VLYQNTPCLSKGVFKGESSICLNSNNDKIVWITKVGTLTLVGKIVRKGCKINALITAKTGKTIIDTAIAVFMVLLVKKQ